MPPGCASGSSVPAALEEGGRFPQRSLRLDSAGFFPRRSSAAKDQTSAEAGVGIHG